MSRNKSTRIQSCDQSSPDVEALLQRLKLRSPSNQLDEKIAKLVDSEGSNVFGVERERQQFLSRERQFGWTAIFATAAAAMFAGLLLGQFYSPADHNLNGSSLAVADSGPMKVSELTPVSFNVDAFNLLHGHSQQEEFGNCEQCHHQSDPEEDAFAMIFERWFYGDDDFFEAHLDGLDGCAKCHVFEKKQEDFGKETVHGFEKLDQLANCSDCHKVDAEGFGGFKKTWHSKAVSSSDG
jgi:hypothetical protein